MKSRILKDKISGEAPKAGKNWTPAMEKQATAARAGWAAARANTDRNVSEFRKEVSTLPKRASYKSDSDWMAASRKHHAQSGVSLMNSRVRTKAIHKMMEKAESTDNFK